MQAAGAHTTKRRVEGEGRESNCGFQRKKSVSLRLSSLKFHLLQIETNLPLSKQCILYNDRFKSCYSTIRRHLRASLEC